VVTKIGIYWLRGGVPAELRDLVGKREEKLSLKARDPSEAKRVHAAEMAKLEERWAKLRQPPRSLAHRELHEITVLAYQAAFIAAASGALGA
jgi:hypothetical protein